MAKKDLTDETLERFRHLRLRLDLEPGVLGQAEDEEVTLVWVEVGKGFLLVVTLLDELCGAVSVSVCKTGMSRYAYLKATLVCLPLVGNVRGADEGSSAGKHIYLSVRPCPQTKCTLTLCSRQS